MAQQQKPQIPRFTRDPWRISRTGMNGSVILRIQTDIETVCDLPAGPRQKPNAQLIATAPDLFRALQDMLTEAQFYGVWPEDKYCIRQSQTVINKVLA